MRVTRHERELQMMSRLIRAPRGVGFSVCMLACVLIAGCHDPISPAAPQPHASGDVSVTPPDGVPEGLASSTNTVTNAARFPESFVRDVVIVLFQPDATAAQRTDALARVNGTVIGGIRLNATDGYYLVSLPADPTNNAPLDAVDSLSHNPAVRHASVDFILEGATTFLRPNDGPGWEKSTWRLSTDSAWSQMGQRHTWALEADNTPWAWGCSTGTTNTSVAVIDMGLRDVTDLHDNIVASSRLWTNGSVDHGTQVASVIAARGGNGIGMTGVMWRAGLRLYDVTAHDSTTGAPIVNSLGEPVLSSDQFLTALSQSLGSGARVVNISLGLKSDSSGSATAQDSSVRQTIKGWFWDGVQYTQQNNPPLFVIAAGNYGTSVSKHDAWWSGFPTVADTLPNVTLVVGAADTTRGQVANFSSNGRLVSIAAPGVSVGVLNALGANTVDDGASFATAQVTGVAGLLFAFDSSLTAAQVRTLILQGAADGGNAAGQWSMVDAYHALQRAAQRPGAPLCGNHVWVSDDDKLTVSRGSGSEVIATLPANGVNGTYNAYVNAKHGGRRVEVNGYAVEYDPNTRSWSHVTTSDYTDLDNGMFSAINGTSHDGDAFAWSDVSFNASTNSRMVAVKYQAPDRSIRTITTLAIPLTAAPQVCVTQTISTGQCTQYAPAGSFTDAAYMDPSPVFTGSGQAVLLAIDRLDGTIAVGDWVTDGDTKTRTAGGASVQVARTDVYRIPLSGTVPSDLLDHPAWSLSGRDVYWIAGSEDDREFGVGSFVYTNPTTAPFDCKNEYRSNSGDATRTFGTFLSQPGTGAGPTGGDCWGDEKAAIAPNRLVPTVRLVPAPALTPVQPTQSASSRGSLWASAGNTPKRIVSQAPPRAPVQLHGYRFPDGLWEVGPNGRVQLTELGHQRHADGAPVHTR